MISLKKNSGINQPLIIGSYICDCLDTLVRDHDSGECECADGFESQDGTCVDINECDDNPCRENEVRSAC